MADAAGKSPRPKLAHLLRRRRRLREETSGAALLLKGNGLAGETVYSTVRALKEAQVLKTKPLPRGHRESACLGMLLTAAQGMS